MSDFLKCTCEHDENTVTIRLSGSLTVGRVNRLAEAIGEARRAGARCLVLDLGGLETMDPAGFSFLKANLQFFATKTVRLRLIGLAPELTRMPELGPEDRALLASWTGRILVGSGIPEPDKAGQERDGGAEWILLVDDEPLVLDFMANYLEHRGFNVLKAAGGREALELLERHPQTICLAVVDFMMPEMSGVKLVDTLAARAPGLRVILTSGVGGDALERMNHPGIHGRLQKPFYGSLLEAAIRKALGEAG